MIDVIVPSRTDAYLERLIASMVASDRDVVGALVVGDNGLSAAHRARHPWVRYVDVPDPFNFSSAVNACVAHARPGADLLVLNDDTEIVSPDFLRRLAPVGPDRRFGIVSLRIDGGVGNPEQTQDVAPGTIVACSETVCFVAVLIPRAVWDHVGPMDPRFDGYGFEDDDYCRRVRDAGFACGVTGSAVVRHGVGSYASGGTYRRLMSLDDLSAATQRNRELYADKWRSAPARPRRNVSGIGTALRGGRLRFSSLAAPVDDAPARRRIFVLIPAYRDVECQWTVRDLFERADRPDDVTVGISWQFDPFADADCFTVQTRPDQVRMRLLHAREAPGPAWALADAWRLWQGEEFILQIDSHMRFADGWDTRLVRELARCDSDYPVLTTYPWGYTPPRTLDDGPPPRMVAKGFNDDGILTCSTVPLDSLERPAMQAFCAGGFAFSRADAIVEVPHDPHLYFVGTEISQAVRLWTHGWDFFAPTENVVYHYYGPGARQGRMHWDDHADWTTAMKRSGRRLRHLLQAEVAADPDTLVEMHRYGLGTLRSLAEYERFAGVDFAARTITRPHTDAVGAPPRRRVRAARSR